MKFHVMAVDDEPGILVLLKTHLDSMGCDVVAVVDGLEALKRLEDEKFDGLFVDVVMPIVDGVALIRRVRQSKLNCHVPIVVVTAYDDAETMRRGFEAGANFFLGKPFTRERVWTLLGVMRGPMLREKQRYTRLAYCTEVDYGWGPAPRQQHHSSSLNISEGGMLLSPSPGLTVGREFQMSFHLPNVSHPLNAQATVVRMAPPNGVGVKFLLIDPRDERDLQNYLQARLED